MMQARSKPELRRWALERRRALAPEQLMRMSTRIGSNLQQVDEFRCARHILTYLSFDNEVDTWRLVEELAADPERRVYVPRVDADGVMHVHPYPCELRTLRMGLRQPAAGEAETPRERIDEILDAALVPGLLFDRRGGYRLGRGKGHFDRFLRGRRCCAIGLSFEAFFVDGLPAEPHDVPMRLIITEQRVYRFGRERPGERLMK